MFLLVGGTGDLGGRIARCLSAHAVPFRALVRPGSGADALDELGAAVVRGDLRDPATLEAAVAGVDTVVTCAHSLDRIMSGRRDVTIRDVDLRGNLNLVQAAEDAGVERFVFVSFPGAVLASGAAFAEAKLATERRLARSSMREVVLRPDAFQEPWLSGSRGFDWRSGTVTILGRGTGVAAYVAMDDVAEAAVRLALHPDPPSLVEFGGPEALSRNQVADIFDEFLPTPLRRRHVPRFAMLLGAAVLGPFLPGPASVLRMALYSDQRREVPGDDPLRDLGIDARPVRAYIQELVRADGWAAPPA